MNSCTILEKIASREANYRPLPSLELAGTGKAYAMKCEEGLFLVPDPDGFRLIDQTADTVYSKDRLPLPSCSLDGWHADLALAPGFVVPCDFTNNAIVLDGTKYEVQIGQIRPGSYLVTGSKDGFVFVLDVSRFLLYGIIRGTVIGGYVRNMPQN
ncbi:MAG: hypothetical protein II781_05280 [Clostridia bacterium]|nr:hypothetical protein [Clostridia bacterium]